MRAILPRTSLSTSFRGCGRYQCDMRSLHENPSASTAQRVGEPAARGYRLRILTWAVSLILGGMFASWFDGKADQTAGALHGITVWALSVAASALLFALGLTHVVPDRFIAFTTYGVMKRLRAHCNSPPSAIVTAPAKMRAPRLKLPKK